MKRSELKVGREYAVLSPSQTFDGYSAPRARRVVVLDLEAQVDDWGHSWSARPNVKVSYRGQTVEAADYTYSAGHKRSVKVLEVYENWTGKTVYHVRAVPLANIRYTWAEFKDRVRAHEEARERRYQAERRAAKEKQEARERATAKRDKLNAILHGTRLEARLLEGQVVLAGTFETLEAIAREAKARSM